MKKRLLGLIFLGACAHTKSDDAHLKQVGYVSEQTLYDAGRNSFCSLSFRLAPERQSWRIATVLRQNSYLPLGDEYTVGAFQAQIAGRVDNPNDQRLFYLMRPSDPNPNWAVYPVNNWEIPHDQRCGGSTPVSPPVAVATFTADLCNVQQRICGANEAFWWFTLRNRSGNTIFINSNGSTSEGFAVCVAKKANLQRILITNTHCLPGSDNYFDATVWINEAGFLNDKSYDLTFSEVDDEVTFVDNKGATVHLGYQQQGIRKKVNDGFAFNLKNVVGKAQIALDLQEGCDNPKSNIYISGVQEGGQYWAKIWRRQGDASNPNWVTQNDRGMWNGKAEGLVVTCQGNTVYKVEYHNAGRGVIGRECLNLARGKDPSIKVEDGKFTDDVNCSKW